jgi:hypothetical protein
MRRSPIRRREIVFAGARPGPVQHLQPRIRPGGVGGKFVSINHDALYSIAQVNVCGGPLPGVPDAAWRYYVLHLVDAWTNKFASVGRRATSTAAGTFLLPPPA